MENKITILLQDKDIIKELAEDPEVQIKIKNAILDGIGKRALKISNVSDKIIDLGKAEIEDYFFSKVDGYWQNKFQLKDEWKNEIHEQVKFAFYNLLNNEIQDLKHVIQKKINEVKEEMINSINSYDLEKLLIKTAENVIKEKLK